MDHLSFPPLDFTALTHESSEISRKGEDVLPSAQAPHATRDRPPFASLYVVSSVNAVLSEVHSIEESGVQLLAPDLGELEKNMNEVLRREGEDMNSLLTKDSFFEPLPIIDGLCLPDYISPSNQDDGSNEDTQVSISTPVSTLGAANQLPAITFDPIEPYLEKIRDICVGIDVVSLRRGISGIAKLLAYMIDEMGIFVTDREGGILDRGQFLKEIRTMILSDDASITTGDIPSRIRQKGFPVFRSHQLEKLGFQFATYTSLYQRLKSALQGAHTNDRKTKAILRELGGIALPPKIERVQQSFGNTDSDNSHSPLSQAVAEESQGLILLLENKRNQRK